MSESSRSAAATAGDAETARRGIEGIRRVEAVRAAAFIVLVVALVVAGIATGKSGLLGGAIGAGAVGPVFFLAARRERNEDAAAYAVGGEALVERYRVMLNRRASPSARSTYRHLYVIAVALAVPAGILLAELFAEEAPRATTIVALSVCAAAFVGLTAHDAFVWRPRLARDRAAFGGPTPDDPGDVVLRRTAEIAAGEGFIRAIVYFRDATGASLAEATAAVKGVAPAAKRT